MTSAHKLQESKVFVNTFLSCEVWLGLHMVVRIPSSNLSQEIYAIDNFESLKPLFGT